MMSIRNHWGSNQRYPRVALLLSSLFFVPALMAQPNVELGSLHGALVWNALTPATTSHLALDPVVAAPIDPLIGTDDTVSAFPPGQFIPVAKAPYAPDNSQPDTTSYRAATYQMAVPVDAAGSDFLVDVDSVAMQHGGEYRFGSRRPGSPWAQLCSGVLPESGQPAGVQCDLEECPAVLDLNIRLTGDSADLDDLQDPIVCGAQIGTEEIAGLGSYDLQARSGPNLLFKGQLVASGAAVPVLVRSGAALQVAVGCEATVDPSVSGFPMDANTGLAVFVTAIEMPALPCGTQAAVDVDVPVMRNAGDLTGLLDLGGYDVQSAFVRPRPGVGGNFLPAVSAPTFASDQQPDRDQPADFWTLEGLVEGAWQVEARALVAGGDFLLNLPNLGGANGVAAVTAGETTDLDTTFVTMPREAGGQVVLVDPGGATDLDQLRNQPITSTSFNRLTTSAVEARGDEDAGVGEGGGSGYRGVSIGRMIGNYNDQLHRAGLDYRLLLAGLSPTDSALDGSDSRPTPWDITSLRVELGDDASYRHTTRVELDQDLHYVVTPAEPADPPLAVPQQAVCFGQINAAMRVSPTDGNLYAPELEVPSLIAITAEETAIPGVTYRARGDASGLPRDSADSSPQASVRLALPEGIRYPVEPRVRFVNSSGTSDSLLSLETREIPSSGELACGAVHDICLDIDAGSGTTIPLSVAFDSPPPVCVPAGQSLSLSVGVDSGGQPVSSVTSSLDGGSLNLLCGPCPGDPSGLGVMVPSLTPGIHELVVEASSANGCTARLTHPLGVADGPLVLSCPQELDVLLEVGEISVAASDPRIADELVATATGACNLPVPIYDNRPDVFSAEETTVVFNAQEASCSTTVRLVGDRAQIALIDGNQVRVHRLDGQLEWQREFSKPADLAYDSAGEKLVVVDDLGGSLVSANDGSNMFQFPSFSNRFKRVAFRPNSEEDLAFLVAGVNSQTNGPYHLWVRLEGVNQNQPLQSTPIQMPNGWHISTPSIAWSPDGQRIMAAWDAVFPANVVSENEHRLFVAEWTVTDGVLGMPETFLNWTRDRREAAIGVGYIPISGELRLLATTQSLYTIDANQVLQPVAPSEVGGLHFAAIGPEPAIVTFGGDLPFHLSLVYEGGVTHAAGTADKGTAVAFNVNPHRRVAVGIGGEGFKLYRIEVDPQQGVLLTEDLTVPATSPGPAVRFRPPEP